MKSSKQSIQLTTGKKAPWKCLSVVAAMGVGMIFLPMTASALTGHCANCHTMHNSQGGLPMNFDGSTVPNEVLLRGVDCIACHSDTGALAIKLDGTPVVFSPILGTGPTDSLAAGNFTFTNDLGDAYGHNVDGISGADPLGNTPPGGVALGSQLTCAGTTGCHGLRADANQMLDISGAHHGNNAAGTLADGLTLGTSYRFLDGVEGIEDTDWEYSASDNSIDHNQYKGVDRGSDAGAIVDPTTISSLCAQCHNAFHNTSAGTDPGIQGTAWGSPWVRHPTDFDLAAATGAEYANYGTSNGGTAGDYKIAAPVASDLTGGVLDSVTFSGDDAVVTCISCHRAHGTEFHDLLRWNYDGIVANGNGADDGGCKECHTTK